MKEYVYYVCYGSNLLTERFLLYITGGESKELNITQKGCKDKSLPLETIKYELPHNIYFAKKSGKWENMGVAFLDTSTKGHSYTKGYLITKQQYLEVSKQEGLWYDNEICLGEFNGYPLYSFTSSVKYPQTVPGEKYLNVIRKGLKETHESLTNKDIDEYFKRSILWKRYW